MRTLDKSAIEPRDYEKKENIVVPFQSGTGSADVDITIVDDDYFEDDEHFYVDIHTPTKGALGILKKTLVIVKDSDTPGNLVCFY